MPEIISFLSFRRGAGKSSLAANTAALLAAQGKHVGVVDADLQSPSAHILFDLDGQAIRSTLTDYLKGNCRIEQAVYDVSRNLGVPISGQVYLAPGSTDPLKIMRLLREGYDVSALTDGIAKIAQIFELDYLVIDTNAGVNVETLATMALTDTLVLLLRLDQQDYQGTAVMFEIAQKMAPPRLTFVVNDVPKSYDLEQVIEQISRTYPCPPDIVIPHSNDMLTLASNGIFALKYPDHPLTGILKRLVAQVTGS